MSKLYVLPIAVLIGGCAVAGTVNVSEPFIEYESNNVSLKKDGVLQLGGIEVSLRPLTSKINFLFIGPILPIIPLGKGENIEESKNPLQLEVKFSSTKGKHYVVPNELKLHYGGKTFEPESFLGPVSRSGKLPVFDRKAPGHPWDCDRQPEIRRRTDTAEQQDVSGTQCLILNYPVSVSVKEIYAISIDGLFTNGQRVEVPKVFFRPATKFDIGITRIN